MSNVVHIDRYRPVTTITQERVVQMLNWTPPKHDPLMLTDKTMARLAEDCGWRLYEMLHLNGEDHGPCWVVDGTICAIRLEIDRNALTDAGCWAAITRCNGDLNRDPWDVEVYRPTADGWDMNRSYGASGDTPEYALHAALNDMYREASTDEQ